MNSKFFTKRITYLAVFTAISFCFYMFVKFSLPIFPSFLDLQISDMPALMAGFMLSPIDGVIVILLRTALKLPFTSTDFVGELADLILGIAFVLPSSLVYRFVKTKAGAIIGLIVGSFACVATSIFTNYFILVPFFVNRFFGGNLEGLVGALSSLYKNLTVKNFYLYYLGLGIVPFNILRCFLCSIITFLVYKRFELIFKKLLGDIKT